MKRCKECGNELTKEMIDVNMCWECGAILDESQVDDITLQISKGKLTEQDVIELIDVQEKKYEEEMVKFKIEERKREIENETQRKKDEIDRVTKINDIYEYDMVIIKDKMTGEIDYESIYKVLAEKSEMGWRLVNTFTNEIGKNSSMFGASGISAGTNSTIDQVIMIFERCVSRYNKKIEGNEMSQGI